LGVAEFNPQPASHSLQATLVVPVAHFLHPVPDDAIHGLVTHVSNVAVTVLTLFVATQVKHLAFVGPQVKQFEAGVHATQAVVADSATCVEVHATHLPSPVVAVTATNPNLPPATHVLHFAATVREPIHVLQPPTSPPFIAFSVQRKQTPASPLAAFVTSAATLSAVPFITNEAEAPAEPQATHALVVLPPAVFTNPLSAGHFLHTGPSHSSVAPPVPDLHSVSTPVAPRGQETPDTTAIRVVAITIVKTIFIQLKFL